MQDTIAAPYHEALLNWLSSVYKNTPSYQLKLLMGDGSTRQFYRLLTNTNSYLLLIDPSWTQTQDYPAHQSFLKGAGLPCPHFFLVKPNPGILVMEDLGDTLLQSFIQTCQSPFLELKNAIQLLADLHGKTYPVPDSLPASQRLFDTKKYQEELALTEAQFLKKFLGFTDPVFVEFANKLTQKINAIEPYVFCHRDYHSRNLMVKNKALFLIDFQDARLGPVQYDLASFVYDPYLNLDIESQEKLVASYLEQLNKYPALYEKINLTSFINDLESVGVQRLLKACGSYALFFNRDNKNSYLKYIPVALTTLKRLLDNLKIKPELPVSDWLRYFESLKNL